MSVYASQLSCHMKFHRLNGLYLRNMYLGAPGPRQDPHWLGPTERPVPAVEKAGFLLCPNLVGDKTLVFSSNMGLP